MSLTEMQRLACDFVKNKCPAGYVILKEQPIAEPHGLFFTTNQNAFSNGGYFLDGHSGEIVRMGDWPVHSLDWWLKAYQRGFKSERYKVTFLEIYNLEQTVKIIDDQRLPGLEASIFQQVKGLGSKEVVVDRLTKLPRTFTMLNIKQMVEIVDQFERAGCCKYAYEAIR